MDDDVRELLKEVFMETVEQVFPLKGKKEQSSEQEDSSSEEEASSEEEKPKRTKKGKQSKPRKPAKKSAYAYFRSEMMKGKAKNGRGLTMKQAADLWNKEYKGKKSAEKYQKMADAYNKEHGL